MTEERMLYRRYKTAYADCQTVPGTYDKATKTIVVVIPEGRMKKSGVRGQRVFIPLWKALKEAREDDPRLTETDGICACYEVENMGFCRDGVTRWYHFTSVDGEPAYTLKR